MRIAVVNNFFPPRVGGSSHLSDALAKGYARHGHEVLVVTAAYDNAPASEVRDGVRIVRLPAFMLPESRLAVSFDISFATRPSLRGALRRLLDDFSPDVIHQHGQFMDLTWASGVYAARRNIPTLLTVHTRLENPAALYRNVFRWLELLVVAPQLRRYKPHIVILDSYMKEYIEKNYRRCYRGLVAIPVGVETSWVRGGDAKQGRELMGLDVDVPVVLSIGHVIPLRDRVPLVEALPEVLRRIPNLKVVVAGRVYYDLFLRRAEHLGVRDSIVCLGKVPKAEIPHLLAAATVESHESGEGLGTATLEAMAAGIPVVGQGRLDNFPNLPLTDGEDIFLCQMGDRQGLADRLIAALSDPALAKKVGTTGARLVEQSFTEEEVVLQHLSYFRKILAS